MHTILQPTLQSNRNYFLDVWRGFAITGVLHAYIMWSLGYLPQKDWTSVDKIIAELTLIFLDGKFYTTLSILFGFGFYLQVEKSRLSQQSVTPFALRRILFLLLIGAVHAMILRDGDILVPYAITSLYLFFARNSNNKILIALIIFSFLFPVFYSELIRLAGYKNPSVEKVSGTYLHVIWVNFIRSHNPIRFFVDNLGYFLLFVLGYYAAKNHWLQKLSGLGKRLLIIFAVGIVTGVPFYFLFMNFTKWFIGSFGSPDTMHPFERALGTYIRRLLYLVHTVALAISYFSGLLWLYLHHNKMKPFANLGRMALTNYLTQAMIMFPVCLVFGLFGKFSPTMALGWSGGIWTAQAIFSSWWLKRYNFGPFEYLLRSFTYWKWQPMKKKEIFESIELDQKEKLVVN